MKRERTKKSRPLRWLLGLYGLLLLAALLFVIDGRHVRFYLNGPAETELALGERYTEPGCRAVSAGRLFGEGRELTVTMSGAVDGETLGDYVRSYTARWLFQDYRAVRRVHVVDRTPPEIVLHSRLGYAPSWLEGYEEEGYSALDNVDGDLTDRVERLEHGENLDYIVTDAAGNTAAVSRRIPYSVGRPIIEPTGGAALEIPAAFTFSDPGFTAADAKGYDLSAFVTAEGSVDPTRPGRYEWVYSVTNRVGDTVSVTRQIDVVPAALPEAVIPEEKTIYLTFDDGPGPYTGRLLDVLKEYGVKATFFVTCRYPDYFDMVGRAYREGHAVGVHSATHNYYEIYASEEAFYEDFRRCEEMVYEQTGQHTTLFRFPGGSSNTVSSFNEGIMTRLTASMNAMGYQYFDWNVDSDDAGKTHTSWGVLKNIQDGCEGKDYCLVLQHDVKDYSVAALRDLILWARENGYTFETLSMSAPTAHHPLAN